MANSQNMVADNEPRRTALGSSVRSTVLNSFPATLRGLSKKEKKTSTEWRSNGGDLPSLHLRHVCATCPDWLHVGSWDLFLRPDRQSFLFGSGRLFVHVLLSTCTTAQINFLQYELSGTLERGLWVCFHSSPSPTPTRQIKKVQPSFHAGSERGRLCCFGLCAPASSTLRSLYRIIHSTQSQRTK